MLYQIGYANLLLAILNSVLLVFQFLLKLLLLEDNFCFVLRTEDFVKVKKVKIIKPRKREESVSLDRTCLMVKRKSQFFTQKKTKK